MRKFVPLGAAEGDKYSNVPLEPSMVRAVSAILLQVISMCSAPTKYSSSYLFCTHKTNYVSFTSGSGSSSRLMLDLRLFYADIENASVTGSSFIMFQLIARCPCVLSFFN